MKRAAITLALLMLFVTTAEASEVTMNLAFSIDGKSTDVIHANGTSYSTSSPLALTFSRPDKKYISSEGTGNVLALVFAGSSLINLHFNTTYSVSDYLIQMTQSDRNNRFIITYVNGTRSDVEDDLPAVDIFRTVSKTFGTFPVLAPPAFPLFLRLQPQADIQNFYEFGGVTKLMVRNLGKENGVTKVGIGPG